VAHADASVITHEQIKSERRPQTKAADKKARSSRGKKVEKGKRTSGRFGRALTSLLGGVGLFLLTLGLAKRAYRKEGLPRSMPVRPGRKRSWWHAVFLTSLVTILFFAASLIFYFFVAAGGIGWLLLGVVYLIALLAEVDDSCEGD